LATLPPTAAHTVAGGAGVVAEPPVGFHPQSSPPTVAHKPDIVVPDDQTFDQDCVGMGERLSSAGDEFGYNAVVLLSAGGGAVLAEVIHLASDSDEGSAGGFVSAVFWELFSCVNHKCDGVKCVSITLFITILTHLRIKERMH